MLDVLPARVGLWLRRFGLLALVIVLTACQQSATASTTALVTPTSLVNSIVQTAVASTLAPKPSQTPTVKPTEVSLRPAQRSLVICLGQEPRSLYLYSGTSRAMWSVLEAIYDGPIDTRQYTPQPVILSKLPSLQDGDAAFQPVDMEMGEVVIDAAGNLVALAAGVKVIPSGCDAPECAVAWDGVKPLKMNRMVVQFQIRPEVKWSDGTPLTAEDSVYSFKLSNDPHTPVSKTLLDRTSWYKAIDTQTVQWAGKPGYFPTRFETLFWHPLPQHVWGSFNAQELLHVDESTRAPLGWGAYIIEEWVSGDHIRLRKNPNYFRAAEQLPYFDALVYRFVGEPADSALAALLANECDFIDPSVALSEQLQGVRELEVNKKLKMFTGQGPEVEQLFFGIRPASYDDGYSAVAGDRPDFFRDVRVRQAFVQCMDRLVMTQKILLKQSVVPASFLPPDHPLFPPDLKTWTDDVNAANKLLEDAGWKDADKNPATPRTAQGVANVPDKTPLVINYATTSAPLRKEVSQFFARSLAECGIQANVKYASVNDLFAPAPTGPLFGRQFDLVQFAWEASSQPPCFLFETEQIPGAKNNWLGVNLGGYSNPAYDTACQSARLARPDQKTKSQEAYKKTQQIYAQDLPSIPLYYHVKVAAARTDFCGFEMDVTARSALWNLENLSYGECKK